MASDLLDAFMSRVTKTRSWDVKKHEGAIHTMKNRSYSCVVIFSIFLNFTFVFLSQSANASLLYSVNFDGELQVLNTDTKSLSIVGPTGIAPGIAGNTELAFRNDGTLFGFNAQLQSLYTIDINTGIASFVTNSNLDFNSVGSLTFDALGRLLTINRLFSEIMQIDTSNGNATIVGRLQGTTFRDIRGLTVAPIDIFNGFAPDPIIKKDTLVITRDGVLFALDPIFTDPTGVTTYTERFVSGFGLDVFARDIHFLPDGSLVTSGGAAYFSVSFDATQPPPLEIITDYSTPAGSKVGSGLALFAETTVPVSEPHTLALLGVGLLAIGTVARNRRVTRLAAARSQ